MAPNNENVKSDAAQLPQTSDHGEILKQVEFYFSDNNLPFDKFLWTETQKNDGWVPIKTIHSFKRMQRFQPFEDVVKALKSSKELLEVSEDGENVRRATSIEKPGPQESKSRFARTVYAKGFGEEKPTSQFDIEEFFSKHGPLNQVRLRRTDDGQFKESVFAEFSNLEDAKKFIEQEKPKFGDNELVVMSKQAYVEMKSEQHNFADRANGRRKPKFNAFKQMQAPKRNPPRRQSRNKRAADTEVEDAPAKRSKTETVETGNGKETTTVSKSDNSVEVDTVKEDNAGNVEVSQEKVEQQ